MVKRITVTLVLLLSILMVMSGCNKVNVLPTAGNTYEGSIDGVADGTPETGTDEVGATEAGTIETGLADGEAEAGTIDAGLAETGTDDAGTDEVGATDGKVEGNSENTREGPAEVIEDVSKEDNVDNGTDTGSKETSYKLKEPEFLKLESISLNSLAEDYINLSDDEFSKRYSDEKLWELGAFDRLLFTGRAKGKIIGNIGIGSTLQQVLDTFGKCQFGTEEIIDKASGVHEKYSLYGYKTRDFYFTFQVNSDTKLVESICFRKRYVLPDEVSDMLVVLSEYGDWYGGNLTGEITDLWEKYFENDRIKLTQWGRGSMTMICDYGFTTTAGFDLSYGVYGDYTGDIPVLPSRSSEWGEGTYDPITVFELDYPESMIYRIYSYLAEQEDVIKHSNGMLSPDGCVYAYAVEGNWLDIRSSRLYESAHVVFHSMDGRFPDKHLYFGHFSSLVGFIGDRYFVETNMMGLHVVDLKDWSTVYREDTVDGGYDLRLDEKNKRILDSEGNIWYTYEFDSSGGIKVYKVDK
jgi:hypothetical protein